MESNNSYEDLKTTVVDTKVDLERKFLSVIESLNNLSSSLARQQELEIDLENIKVRILEIDSELEDALEDITEDDVDNLPDTCHDELFTYIETLEEIDNEKSTFAQYQDDFGDARYALISAMNNLITQLSQEDTE